MIHLMPSRSVTPETISRRDVLRLTAASSLGLSLPRLLEAEAARKASGSRTATAKNCIYIFLCGGPSQLDMWDPKPDAPAGIRSQFAPLATNVPGIYFSELLPRVARHADKLAILRSLTHDNSSHETGILYTLLATGNPPTRNAEPPSRQDPPAIGGALHHLLGAAGELPAWVVLPRFFTTGPSFYKGQTAGFLGPAFDPFALDEPKKSSLAQKEFQLDALNPLPGVHAQRLTSREGLLERIDGFTDAWLRSSAIDQQREYREKALGMLASANVRRAFDLSVEPPTLRDRYGRNEYGQSFLMARRLVEGGVRMVNVFWTYYGDDGCQFNLWDNHGIDGPVCGGYRRGIDMIQAPYCCPAFDLAFSALLEDLTDRGLLDDTLVVVIGEFGRTPKINKNAGRDHWPQCYSAVLAGGGVQGGRVYGASDGHAAYVSESPVTPDDFGATIYHAFGVPPDTVIYDQLERPLPVSRGEPVTAVF